MALVVLVGIDFNAAFGFSRADGIALQRKVGGLPRDAHIAAVCADFIQCCNRGIVHFNARPKHIGVHRQRLSLAHIVQRVPVFRGFPLGVVVQRFGLHTAGGRLLEPLPLVSDRNVLPADGSLEGDFLADPGLHGRAVFRVKDHQRLKRFVFRLVFGNLLILIGIGFLAAGLLVFGQVSVTLAGLFRRLALRLIGDGVAAIRRRRVFGRIAVRRRYCFSVAFVCGRCLLTDVFPAGQRRPLRVVRQVGACVAGAVPAGRTVCQHRVAAVHGCGVPRRLLRKCGKRGADAGEQHQHGEQQCRPSPPKMVAFDSFQNDSSFPCASGRNPLYAQ